MSKRIAWSAALAVAGVAVATANPTFLCSIPIADILAHREATYLYAFTGGERNITGGAYTHYQNGIVGLFERVELGYANDFNGWTVTGCKVLLSESETGAVSVGLMNYDGHHADPFAVGRLDFKGWRAHGGVIRDDRHRIVLGADFELPHGWSGMADWTSGPTGDGWVGVNIPVRGIPGLNVMPMVGFPNTKGDGIQHSVNVWFGFRF